MKNDARVRYTRMVIENSFLELLQNKPVSRITVTDICRRSSINRTTFYKHYTDPLDLMEKLEEELLESVRSMISQKSYMDITAVFCDVLNALKENSGRYRALVSAHGHTSLPGRIFTLCHNMIFPLICSRYPNLDSIQQNLLYCYITQGFSGTVNCWLGSGMKEPAEEIAEFASRATRAVTRDFAQKKESDSERDGRAERAVKNGFFQMLLDCYGLWAWEYNDKLELLTTNSISPHFHGLLLLGRDRRDVILQHGQKTTLPLIVSNTIGTMWAVVANHDSEGKPESFYAIGPTLTGEYARKEVEQAAEKLNLSIRNKLAVLDCVKSMPYVSANVLFQHVVALHYYVTGKKARISDFVYYTAVEQQKRKKTEDDRMPHAPLYTEKKLLDMVRTGNLDYHDALSESGSVSSGIRLQHTDPVRQAKYSVVAFITLCSRAAIEGGLSSEWAYTLCDIYTAAVDSAQNLSQIAVISHTMYEDFIRRVNLVRRRAGKSKPVRMCCDYIDTHVSDHLNLKALADHVGYTEYYLSRKFKAETGVSVNAYICQARMREARSLLSATNLSVQEIADRLHFCSRSYFSEQFKKDTGMLPVEYRENFFL